MEPVRKKTKITDHFRVALKPRDLNIISLKSQQQQQGQHHLSLKQQNQQQQQTLKNVAPQPPKPSIPSQQLQLVAKAAAITAAAALPTNTTTTTTTTNKHLIRRQPIIFNYDQSQLNNVHWEPHYAWDSFAYDREQEVKYLTRVDPLKRTSFAAQRRAQLVDFLVEIQIRFSLDHEPLYMAVKMADQYQAKRPSANTDHVLLYITSMLVAAKYDERIPPVTISDLISLAKSRFSVKYSRRQIISLEIDLLLTLDFNLRFPLSYGFLRRFARCTRSDMKTIHLARYILECSLMDYEMIEILDSKLAAGSLLLAMIHLNGVWDETAKHYSGYNEKELYPLIINLNTMLCGLAKKKTAIRRKYSNESFMEVARIGPIQPELLQLLISTASET